ncbi:MAG: hypothetical protein IIA99_03015 [Proteobacteria bacterium]|nr:hypothetical protein [Pseudomonadota bacterium]
MKRIIFVIIMIFPLIIFGATSANYKLGQEGTGFTEFDGDSASYKFKAVIGDAVSEVSTSANYTIDQRRIWAVVVTPPSPSPTPSTPAPSGGGGGIVAQPQTGVSFSGRAYPLSRIDLLKDGQIVASTIAGPDARFSIIVTGINAGSHTFSVIGKDTNGLRSQSFSFPITVSTGVTTYISGLFLAPTLAVDKKVVKRGDNIAIFGQTVPESKVIIGVASEHETFRITDADKQGVFLYNFDTTQLEMGDHETRAKATKDNEISEFGRTVAFEVGNRTVLNTDIGCPPRGDLNNDCRVNLIDLSIAGFWYKKTLSETMAIRERAILNGDGVIDLVDLSIMGFYWTG